MRRVTTVFFAVTVALSTSAAAQPEEDEDAPPCPEVLRGAQLVVGNVDGGVTFRITTPERGRIELLRMLIRELAGIVERHAQEHATEPVDPETIPPVKLRVTNVTRGALVTIRPERLRNLDLVRLQAKRVAAFWSEWWCVNDYMPPVTRTVKI